MKNKFDRIVFCDFDGTITTEDAFVHVCRHFAPEATEQFLKKVMEGSLTLKDGIRMIVDSIPSSEYPEMLDYVNGSKIRPGLGELLDYLDEKAIPFVVVSGGLKGLVVRQLGDVVDRTEAVFAADVTTAGEYLNVVSDFENGPELVNKIEVMKEFTYNESVAIGDGITDHNMALASDTVFARKHLADYLEKNNHPYHTWKDFHEVRDILYRMWG